MEAAAAADESASNLTAIELSRGDDDSDTFGRVAQLLDALQQDCDDSRTQIAADAHAKLDRSLGPSVSSGARNDLPMEGRRFRPARWSV